LICAPKSPASTATALRPGNLIWKLEKLTKSGWQLVVSGMTAGGALVAATAALMKLLS
jgi:hypothetical protein